MSEFTKKFYPYHIVNVLGGVDNSIRKVMIIVKSGSDYLSNAVVMLMGGGYVYAAKTNIYGQAYFPQIANEVYTVYIAKRGLNQEQYDNIEFDVLNTSTQLQYSEDEKTEWDGMYANTAPQFYVNTLDGGEADNSSDDEDSEDSDASEDESVSNEQSINSEQQETTEDNSE